MYSVSEQLAQVGLNLQAVFQLNQLPDTIQSPLKEAVDDYEAFTQLLLLGHGGQVLWDAVKSSGISSANPIDDFTKQTIKDFFRLQHPKAQFQILYPGEPLIPLQQLGDLAGWHFQSPFMVGVNDVWGSWYAYRAVVIANTQFQPSEKADFQSSCKTCQDKPCLDACPSGAVSENGLDMAKCTQYRKVSDSRCQDICHARVACPVGRSHQYKNEQIRYHYLRSLSTIKKYY